MIGLEALLKYKPDARFFGWIAYTLSRSVRRDAPDLPQYLFQYDQTHNLIILGQAKRPEGREFYLRRAIQEQWSSRELERQFRETEYLGTTRFDPTTHGPR